MGKASRLRRERMDKEGQKPQAGRGFYATMRMSDMRGKAAPQDDDQREAVETALTMQGLIHGALSTPRIIQFERSQVEGFELNQDLKNYNCKPPFQVTYLDFAFAQYEDESCPGVLVAEVNNEWVCYAATRSASTGMIGVLKWGPYSTWAEHDSLSAHVLSFRLWTASAIAMLESANVDLVKLMDYPSFHVLSGLPLYEVAIRQNTKRYKYPDDHESQARDWSHRWEVRGHFKHFTKGPVYRANPDRRVTHKGVECVRVWCPPYVKGPTDRPFIPKLRRVV